jgi:hypothetical protein
MAATIIRSVYLSGIFDPNLLEKTGITESVAKPIIDMLSGEWTTEAFRKASKLVPNQVAEHFSLWGSPDEIVEKEGKLLEMGNKQVAINPYAPKGKSTREIIIDFVDNVIKNFV